MPESAHLPRGASAKMVPATRAAPVATKAPLASKLHAAGIPKLYDPGFATTIAYKSAITDLNGTAGILRYRGYPIEKLAAVCTFDEVAHLLLHARLPTRRELDAFRVTLSDARYTALPRHIACLIESFPASAHPMTILTAALAALAASYPELNPSIVSSGVYNDPETRRRVITIVLAVFPTLAAAILHHTTSTHVTLPSNAPSSAPQSYTYRFLSAALPSLPSQLVTAFDTLLILHADHEQNCSTSAVRHLSSSGVDVFSSLSAGAAALYGPLHGGASEAVIHMLARIGTPSNVPAFLAKVKARRERLMGFGHRVYKTYDPRARIVRSLTQTIVSITATHDPLIDVALALESAALSDDYFVSRKLYPNIDFYSGIIYKAMGVPPSFFTVMFALGRIAGWLSHWLEFLDDPDRKIARPHQAYIGVLGPLPVPSLDSRDEDRGEKDTILARL